jgi:hypothetical protein
MVRALDVQQVLLQSNAVERVQQVQQHLGDIQQRHFESQLAKEKRSLRKKVKNLEEAERLRIREEQERDKREKKNKSSKREKEGTDDKDGDLSDGEPVGRIDIRI